MPSDVVATLLRSPEPSIRWKVRVGVLGEDPGSRAMRALRSEIRGSPRVRALLSRRDKLGKPGTARQVYYKWQGLHWVLAALADLGYPESDESLLPIRGIILSRLADVKHCAVAILFQPVPAVQQGFEAGSDLILDPGKLRDADG